MILQLESRVVFLKYLVVYRHLNVKVPDLIPSICKVKKKKKAVGFDPTITYEDQNVSIPFNQRKGCAGKKNKKKSNHGLEYRPGPLLVKVSWRVNLEQNLKYSSMIFPRA